MSKAERIRTLRKIKGMSQEEFAKQLNTTKQTISKYENGTVTNIPSDRLERMARVLDTTPEYLMGWKSEEVEANNDLIVEVVVKMRSDEKFRESVALLLKAFTK